MRYCRERGKHLVLMEVEVMVRSEGEYKEEGVKIEMTKALGMRSGCVRVRW